MEANNLLRDIVLNAEMRLGYYQQLIDLANEQQSILIDGKCLELSECTDRFDSVILELKNVHDHELLLISQLHDEYPGIDEYQNAEYAALRSDILKKAIELRGLISDNSELLKNAINLTQFSIDLLYKISASAAEEPGSGDKSIVFDAKV